MSRSAPRIAVPEHRKTRVFIVDDHPIVREGLARLIDQELDMMVAGWAEDAQGARESLRSTECDLLVLDLTLPGTSGFHLVEELREEHPEIHILILSMHAEPFTAERALKAGANGYITKAEAPEKVLDAIRTLRNDKLYLTEEIATKLLSRLADGPTQSPISSLSNRELEVLRHIGEGLSTRRIAATLDLSVKTVETYRANLKRKLQLEDSAELVNYAVRFVLAEGGNAP